MKRTIVLLSSLLLGITASLAQVAQWIVPPAYEHVEMPEGASIAITDSANTYTIWSLSGKRLHTTTDNVFPLSEGMLVTTSIYDDKISGLFNASGTAIPFEQLRLGWAYPCYHNGYLLVFDGHYFYYMNTNGEVVSQEYVKAYPFSQGYASVFSYENVRKQKDPYREFITPDLQPITLQLDGKPLSRSDDVEFISSVNDEGLAIVVVKRKLYYFNAKTRELTPCYLTPDETNPKNQLKLDGDVQSSTTSKNDSTTMRAKCGREQVVITFDYIMKPIAVTHSQQRHEFLSAPDVIHNHSDHMARTPENNVNGPFGLSWDGKEVLPPQFKEVNLIVDDKAIVCLNGKYGLLQMHPNDRFRFSLNKGDALGFRHKRFETTIRLDVPSYVHSNATTIDMDGVAGILVDKISRETKNTEYGNYVQYDCVLDIPEGITDELSPISFTANINYDGLRAVPTPFTANAWHSQYYNVEINEKETTISNGTLAFTSDIDPKRLAGEAVYPYTVTLNTNLHFELVEKVSETRYKWKVTGLKEGMNTINVQIQEDGCPPAEVSFDVEYVKRSAKSGPDKVVVTKNKPKPQPVQQHLDV